MRTRGGLNVSRENRDWVQRPTLERIGKQRWRVRERVVYQIPRYGEQLTIEAGYESDLASIPPGLQWLLPPDGEYALAALVHDHLWNRGEVDSGRRLTGAEVDLVFLDAMAELGVRRSRRYLMYYAVRAWRRVSGK